MYYKRAAVLEEAIASGQLQHVPYTYVKSTTIWTEMEDRDLRYVAVLVVSCQGFPVKTLK